MTNQEKDELRQLVKEGTIEALKSNDGQEIMSQASLKALRSNDGQEILSQATIKALNSKEGQDILTKNFVQGFHEVVVPVLEDFDGQLKDHKRRVERIEANTRIIS